MWMFGPQSYFLKTEPNRNQRTAVYRYPIITFAPESHWDFLTDQSKEKLCERQLIPTVDSLSFLFVIMCL